MFSVFLDHCHKKNQLISTFLLIIIGLEFEFFLPMIIKVNWTALIEVLNLADRYFLCK